MRSVPVSRVEDETVRMRCVVLEQKTVKTCVSHDGQRQDDAAAFG